MKFVKAIIYLILLIIWSSNNYAQPTVTSSISAPFGDKIYKGTVYVSQSEFSPNAKAIIQLTTNSFYSDYMPIVLCNELIEKERVGESVYFNIFLENDNYYAVNLNYNMPGNYIPLTPDDIARLLDSNFIDIHNTIDGVDHDQIGSSGQFEIQSHKIGHLWSANVDDQTRLQSRILTAGQSSTFFPRKNRFKFSKEQLETLGLRELCLNTRSTGTCTSIVYISRPDYYAQSELIDSEEPLFYDKKLERLNGIRFTMISNVSTDHTH